MKILPYILAAAILIIAVTFGTCNADVKAGMNEIELSEDLPNDGIITIRAGELGYYAIDTRFNLCFLVTMEITPVSCRPFGKALKGKL